MKKQRLVVGNSDSDITVRELSRAAEGWLLDGEIRQHSQRTVDSRRDIVAKLVWFLNSQEYSTCGTLELRQFSPVDSIGKGK